jgi:hypothetical protein
MIYMKPMEINFETFILGPWSSFFCLDTSTALSTNTKESKNQGLPNAPAQILSNCKCGRVIYSVSLRSFPSLLTICFAFACHVLMAIKQRITQKTIKE